jgi:hypothetical protein
MTVMNRTKAISHIQKHGVLIVFPMQNQKLPLSLWSCFFPRTPMRWEWDESGDNRVAELWHLREQLSSSGKIVYAKWFKNRATVFSPDAFRWARSVLAASSGFKRLSADARQVLEIINDNSPLSSKELKKEGRRAGLTNPQIEKALKELWQRLMIVGFGEVDDGAFPSLAVGAVDQLFEDWSEEALDLDPKESHAKLVKLLGSENPFLIELDKTVKKLQLTAPLKKAAKSTGKRPVLTYEDLVSK